MDDEVAGQLSGGGSCAWQEGQKDIWGSDTHQRKPEYPKEWWSSTEVQ